MMVKIEGDFQTENGQLLRRKFPQAGHSEYFEGYVIPSDAPVNVGGRSSL
jgi:hypothetical protein